MKLRKIISAIAAAAILSSNLLPAAAFTVGEDSGAGVVKDVYVTELEHGITYEDVTVKYTDETDHVMRTVTFDPSKNEVIPVVYSKYTGYGSTVPDTVSAAEAAGYNVLAAFNGSFFGLSGVSCNTYGGVNIYDGIVTAGNDTFPETEVIAFMPDGTVELVKSKMTYTFTSDYEDIGGIVECINICPDKTYDVIYYYDRFCGTKTDTNTLGVEVVFKKLYGSELTVGGDLFGEVVKIRDGVSSGGAIGKDEFVLYASETSDFNGMLKRLKVGDKITVNAEETIDESRKVLENCTSALPGYGYIIVRDGKNVTSSNGLGEDYNTRRGQKTALGIKPNGEMMFFCSQGREEEHPGITSYELADILISEGCVTGINLDGGYSTTLMIRNENGELETVMPPQRRVANSILLVEKKPPKQLYDEYYEKLHRAKGYVYTYENVKGQEALAAAAAETEYLKNGYFTSDEYIKALYTLNTALDACEVSGNMKLGVYIAFEDAVLYKNSNANSKEVIDVPRGAVFKIEYFSGDYAFTRYNGYFGWVKTESIIGYSDPDEAKLNLKAPDVLYKGESLSLSWDRIDGVSGYDVKITEYDTVGEASSDGVVLADIKDADFDSLTIPLVSRTEGRYVVVDVSAKFPLTELTETVTVITSALPFRDVPRDHWGYASAVHSFEKGYITGVTAETFAPNVTVSRAMMATLVYRIAGSPELSADVSHGFDDVADGAWYEAGVTWCRENGIVSGISDTQFAPDAPVTREQAACFLMRYASLSGDVTVSGESNLADSFSDADSVSAFAVEAVRWATENGIIKGSYGRLDPLGTADRIQLSAILANFDAAVESESEQQ